MTLLIIRRILLRHWRRTPGQNLLLVLILALGVGVFVAIRLANRAALASFQNFTAALVGPSDWVIEAPVGTLPQSVLAEMRAALGTRPVELTPVVEITAAVPAATPGRPVLERATVTLLGLDLIGVSNRSAAPGREGGFVGGPAGFWAGLQGGPRLWVGPAFAGRAELDLIIGDRIFQLPVAGAVPAAPGAPVPPTLAVMDLPELQRLGGKEGRIDRVEVAVADGPAQPERRAEVGALLERLGRDGGRWVVRSGGAQRAAAEQMTRAFRLNLTVLSLVALLVGLYLIVQALDGAVVRRRGEIAILRSLGVEAGVIRAAWMAESVLLGAAGGAVGVLLGWAGAQVAVRLVGRTVNALYFASTVSSASLRPGEVPLALALAIGASAAAGWWPAREAAQVPPAQVLGRAAAPGARFWRRPGVGLALIGLGLALGRLPALRLAAGARFPLAGYAAALAWILGAGMLCAATLPAVAGATRGGAKFSAVLRVVGGHLRRPSGRHRLAAAAVVCAIGMSAGMAVLVESFERTVRAWIGQALQSDVYLYSAGSRNVAEGSPIPAATWQAIAAHAGVADAWVLSSYPLTLGSGPRTVLTGTDLAKVQAHATLPWVEEPRDGAVFAAARNAGLALASESLARRLGLHRGADVAVPIGPVVHHLVVAGIFADYGNERGSLLVERRHLAQWLGDDSATHLSLFTKPGVNPEALRAQLRQEYPGLEALTNRDLRGEILKVFRQTFAITYALEVIGLVVAITGIALTMSSVLLDRQDELTTLRALGFSSAEIALSASVEGLAVAAWAVGWGLALSLGLGWILIHVINKQSFGWTLGFAIPWVQLSILGVAVVAAGGAVSWGVGRFGARLAADLGEGAA